MSQAATMSYTCGTTKPSAHGIWQCTQPGCDGVHHFFEVFPYEFAREDSPLW